MQLCDASQGVIAKLSLKKQNNDITPLHNFDTATRKHKTKF